MAKDDSKGGAGENQDGKGGAPNPPGDDSSREGKDGDSKETVSRADHDRALSDLHKYKKQVGEHATRVSDLQKQMDDLKANVLKDKQDFKGLYESEAQKSTRLQEELQAAKAGNDKLNEEVEITAKYNAVRNAAGKLGLRKEATDDLELVNMEGVVVERTTAGRIFVSGADSFAEKLKSTKPHWFETPKAPGFNPGGGGTPPGDGKNFGVKEFLEVERQYQAGKISKEKYEDAFKKYNLNRQKRA